MRRRLGDLYEAPTIQEATKAALEDGVEIVGQAFPLEGKPYRGLVARVGVRIVRPSSAGESFVSVGSSFSEALRKAARKIEEDRAVGPLEKTEPLRVALRALREARIEIYRLLQETRAFARVDVLEDTLEAERTIARELAVEYTGED